MDWTCLEPDHRLADEIERIRGLGRLPASCKVVRGTLADLPSEAAFGTILYIDVLEHIKDDRAEIASAAARLADGGRLIVLAPAHEWLFSPFDAAIGHHRRYTKSSLVALAMAPLQVCAAHYLDSIGASGVSLHNRKDRTGSGELRVSAVEMRDMDGRSTRTLFAGQDVDISVDNRHGDPEVSIREQDLLVYVS